jgi:hypothetical protein
MSKRMGAVALVVGLSGCVAWLRDPDFYTEQLSELLEAQADSIEACYDRYLEHDPEAGGTLTVEFEVEKQTGQITNLAIVGDRSTVPEELAACVTDELAQTRLDPPDARTARASFTWEFVRGPQKRPPADPFAGASMAMLACYATHLAEVDREAEGELVIDYAFNPTGELERLEIVAEATTAPPPVIECAAAVLRSARPDPEQLEDRNLAGRRSFALRFEPYPDPD